MADAKFISLFNKQLGTKLYIHLMCLFSPCIYLYIFLYDT